MRWVSRSEFEKMGQAGVNASKTFTSESADSYQPVPGTRVPSGGRNTTAAPNRVSTRTTVRGAGVPAKQASDVETKPEAPAAESSESKPSGPAKPRLEGDAEVRGWVPDDHGGGRYTDAEQGRIPEKPIQLRAVDNGAGSVELTWVINSRNQSGFQIERNPPFSGRSLQVGPGTTVCVDPCGPGTYTYTVRAFNEDARSAPSDSATIEIGDAIAQAAPLIVPGSGWNGPTSQPDAVGSPSAAGYDAKAIARFDFVPYQTVVDAMDIGVVAFHINGIERVDFSADGGPWIPVNNMSLNPQSGVWEYVARFRAVDHPGGLVDVRAIVWPITGIPRVLGPLPLYVPIATDRTPLNMYVSTEGNDVTGDGSQANPYRSINKAAKAIEIQQNGKADGGVISLMRGDHMWGPAGRDADGRWISYPETQHQFITVKPAGNLGKRDVRIIGSLGGGMRSKLIHVKNLTVVACELDNAAPPGGAASVIWIHGCTFVGPNLAQPIRWISPGQYPGGSYVTNTVVRDAAEGWSGVTMLRGCTIDGIGDDAFVNCEMIVNCEVRNIVNPPGSGFHSDVFQYHTFNPPFENIIIYNVRAANNTAQGWNIGYTTRDVGPEWSNIAMVNIVNEQSADGYTTQWAPSANHVLWWNITIPVGPLFIIDAPGADGQPRVPTTIRNFSMRGCVFQKFNLSTTGAPQLSDPSWADNNHFIDTTSHGAMTAGTRFTTGGTFGQLFEDAASKDYSARSDSVLSNRIGDPLLPADSLGRRTSAYRAVGGIQPIQP